MTESVIILHETVGGAQSLAIDAVGADPLWPVFGRHLATFQDQDESLSGGLPRTFLPIAVRLPLQERGPVHHHFDRLGV